MVNNTSTLGIVDTMDIILAIATIVNFIYTFNSNKKNRAIEYANIEYTIANSITNAKNRVEDISVDIEECKASNAPSEVLQRKKQRFISAIESLLNAYEEACGKYNDKKIDKKRFKKTYMREIRQLVENRELDKYFNSVTSPYQAILRVYNEWNNIESK